MQQINPKSFYDPLEARPSAPPRWHRVYYLLAAFNVLVVLLGTLLTHQILRFYDHSVEANQHWVEQRNQVADLGTLAGEVDLIAHNCAGTSANCGMVAVMQPLRELEEMGREGCLDGAEALGRQVVSEFQRVKVFLQENLARLAV